MPTLFKPYKPESIDRALLNLRAQIIRDGGEGLRHVNALLRLRGVEPPPVPAKAARDFRRNELRRAIRTELRSGPLTGRELAARVATYRDGLTAEDAYRRVCSALTVMRRKGQVRNGGGVWWLPARC